MGRRRRGLRRRGSGRDFSFSFFLWTMYVYERIHGNGFDINACFVLFFVGNYDRLYNNLFNLPSSPSASVVPHPHSSYPVKLSHVRGTRWTTRIGSEAGRGLQPNEIHKNGSPQILFFYMYGLGFRVPLPSKLKQRRPKILFTHSLLYTHHRFSIHLHLVPLITTYYHREFFLD